MHIAPVRPESGPPRASHDLASCHFGAAALHDESLAPKEDLSTNGERVRYS